MIAPQPAGRREARKQDRRQAIVRAARQSFVENGYAGTSMSGLLLKLGGSKATLWSYFRSKEDLFAAVIEDISASFRQELGVVLAPSGDLRQGLLRFCLGFLHKLNEPDVVAAWRMIVGESGRFPEIGAIFYENAGRPTEEKLAQFLAGHMETGQLRRTDPQQAAEVLVSLCTGPQNRLLWGMKKHGDDSVEDYAAHVVELFVRGYAGRDGPAPPLPASGERAG
jgi:AcrR family transcriptional regulator